MFIGREKELILLQEAYERPGRKVISIYAHWLTGKTALISEFVKDKKYLFFTASNQGDVDNRFDFYCALQRFCNEEAPAGIESLPGKNIPSWRNMFLQLAKVCQELDEQPVIVIEEYTCNSLMTREFPFELTRMLRAFDEDMSITVIISTSDVAFATEPVTNKRLPFLLMVTDEIALNELGFAESYKFWPEGTDPVKAFCAYAVTGGIPTIISAVDLDKPLAQTILEETANQLSFSNMLISASLKYEFRDPARYSTILRAVSEGNLHSLQIANRTGIVQTTLSKYLAALIKRGLLERTVPYGADPQRSKQGAYYIRNGFVHSWYTFTRPFFSHVPTGVSEGEILTHIESKLPDFLQNRFSYECFWALRKEMAKGALSFDATEVSLCWETDEELRDYRKIVIAAGNPETGEMICALPVLMAESPEEIESAAATLANKAEHLSDHTIKGLYLITGKRVSEDIQKAVCDKFGKIGFFCLADMDKLSS